STSPSGPPTPRSGMTKAGWFDEPQPAATRHHRSNARDTKPPSHKKKKPPSVSEDGCRPEYPYRFTLLEAAAVRLLALGVEVVDPRLPHAPIERVDLGEDLLQRHALDLEAVDERVDLVRVRRVELDERRDRLEQRHDVHVDLAGAHRPPRRKRLDARHHVTGG